MLCVSGFQRLFLVTLRPPLPGRALQPDAELRPEGIHTYGGGYTSHVERTGQDVPELRGCGASGALLLMVGLTIHGAGDIVDGELLFASP